MPTPYDPDEDLEYLRTENKKNSAITKASQSYGVSEPLIKAIIGQESAGNPKALSNKNAMGLMQLIPETAKSLGVKDPYDIEQNIYGGTKYIRQLLDQFGGDKAKALAGYNAGPGAVKKYGGIPPFKETQNYVPKILSKLGPNEQDPYVKVDQVRDLLADNNQPQAYDPDEDLKQLRQEAQQKAVAQPEAQQAQEGDEQDSERFALQPPGEYKGFSLLGPQLANGTYATPAIRKKAIDRLLERGGHSEEDSKPVIPEATDSIRQNINNFYSKENLRKGENNLSDSIGNFLYGLGNFNTPGTKGEGVRGVLPRAVGAAESIIPSEEDKGLDFSQRVNRNRLIENEVANLRKERSPIATGAGRIAGDVALYSNIASLLSGIPGLGAATQGEGASKLGEALKLITRGATAGGVTGQFQEGGGNPVLDASLGAGGEALAAAIPAAVNFGGRQFQKILNSLRESTENGTLPEKLLYSSDKLIPYQKAARESAEKTAREAFEGQKQTLLNQLDDIKNEFGSSSKQYAEKLNDLRDLQQQSIQEARATYDANKGIARNKLRDLSEVEPAELGQRLADKIKSSKKNLSKEYGKVADPILEQHGDALASVDDLKSQINDSLKKNNLIDSKGVVDLSKLDLIQSPERKRFNQTLINIQEALKENPTIRTLNSLKQDLHSLANFKAPVRTAEESAFGKLSDSAKTALDDSLQKAAGPQSDAFKEVRAKYAQQKPSLDSLAKTATRLPERLVVNARVQFPKSKVQEILKTNPEFKKEIGDFIFEHITQTPATQNTIRKTVDYYGRDFLKDLIGAKRFGLIMDAEHGLTQAAAKFSPKNFKNEELQRRLGELVTPEELGPFSFDSTKKSILSQTGAAEAESLLKQKQIKDALTKTFNYQDPKIKEIQKKLLEFLGPKRAINPKLIRDRLRLGSAVVPIGGLFKQNQDEAQ